MANLLIEGGSLSFLCFIIFMVGMLMFVFNYIHLLNSLLSLEFMGLGVYLGCCFFLEVNFFFCVFFLVMLVCESVLGLSLLVSGVYSHSSVYMKTFNSIMC